MAEIAGAVFGAFSIISAFKDAIDLFALFTASRDLGRDYIILLTKLDIEKFILLQWAEQVRLLSHDDDAFDDKRLNNPTAQESIAQILSCIALLLGDASQLKKRYGLKDVSKEQDARKDLINVERDTPTMSSPCMVRFEQQFRRLKLEVTQRDESTSVWRKARWVIQDKQKFEDLITELAHFTSKLKELVPPIANYRTRGVELTNTKDLEDIHDLKNLKIILEASTGHRGAIAGSTQGLIDDRCKDRILQTLWFRKMTDRREDITAAHQKTLAWAFQPPEEKHTWDDLSDWLRTGAGIYWISGKAGSGKSTLMKYLYSSQNTKALLSEWTGGKECTIADFFFWYLGTPEQNTQEGLSRALLYQILSRHPELIARALPTMWKEANEVQEDSTPPSAAETKYAFEVLSTSRELSPFCFFIDGVDEYVGNYKDGIALINRLAINPHVKIIASSRPIPQCVAEFEELPMLELQELTRGDISAYVRDIIGNNTYMKRLLQKDPLRSRRIMQDLVQKSSGVFLWVVLACRSLLAGFEDYARIAELERRVQGLPPELEDMFQHMLHKVDKRHEEQASRLLRLCYSKQKAQEQGVTDIDGMYALDVAFSAAYYDLEPIPIQFISDVDKQELCKDLDGRLRSRCGGLLELVKRKSRHGDMSFCFCKAANWDAENALSHTTSINDIAHDVFADAKVCFMHRTVFEFLSGDKVWELDCLKTTDAQFDIPTLMSLSGLYLAVQSQRIRCPAEMSQALTCLRDGINWGVQADQNMPQGEENIFWKMTPLLDSLRALSDPMFDFWSDDFSDLAEAHSHDHDGEFSHATLILAIEAGAVNYVTRHPSLPRLSAESVPSCGCPPLLHYALKSTSLLGSLPARHNVSLAQGDSTRASSAMISMLLSAGCDPNCPAPAEHEFAEMGEAISCWALWLRRRSAWLSAAKATQDEKISVLETLGSFLEADADLQSTQTNVMAMLNYLRKETGLRDKAAAVSRLYRDRCEAQGIIFESPVDISASVLDASSHWRKRSRSCGLTDDVGGDEKRARR